MKWIETKVVLRHPDSDLAIDLISDVFYDFGLQGVVVDDPNIESAEDWAEGAISRPSHCAVTGYFQKDSQFGKHCKILEEKLARFKERIGLFYRINYKELDEEDWEHSWKAYFWPQKIGRNIVVKPTWRNYHANTDEIVIELDPGMAFGTGTHPTTALCISMLENYLKNGDSFLDVGAGSGILMIAAARLGAGKVCGVDNDQAAVKIAGRNLKLNGVESRRFRVNPGNLVEGIQEKYDIVAANILNRVILDLLNDIRRVLNAGGVFICSGIIGKNEKQVVASMRKVGFEILEINSKDEWLAIAGRLMAELYLKP